MNLKYDYVMKLQNNFFTSFYTQISCVTCIFLPCRACRHATAPSAGSSASVTAHLASGPRRSPWKLHELIALNKRYMKTKS